MSEKEYYDLYAKKFGESYINNIANNKYEIERFESVLSLINSNFNSLLDVGCGSGVFLKILQEQYPQIEAYGLERSIHLVDIVRSQLHVNILEGNAEKLPFESNRFDIVTAMEVIEHLPTGIYQKSLQEIERVAGKMIILTVPYKEIRKFVQCPKCQCKFSPIYHLRTFNDKTLSNLFHSYKLVDIQILNMLLPLDFKLRISLKNLFGLHSFDKKTICPSCNFSYLDEELDIDANPQELPRNNRRFTSNILPKINQPIWAVVTYLPA